MKQNDIAKLLREYHAAKVAASKAESLAKDIKTAMAEMGVDTIEGGGYVATVVTVTTTRMDTTRFKRDHPDMAQTYAMTNTTQRLTIK